MITAEDLQEAAREYGKVVYNMHRLRRQMANIIAENLERSDIEHSVLAALKRELKKYNLVKRKWKK